jgi:hypothetical protein
MCVIVSLTYGILTMSFRYMCTVILFVFLSQAATWSLIVFLCYFLYVIKHVYDISLTSGHCLLFEPTQQLTNLCPL